MLNNIKLNDYNKKKQKFENFQLLGFIFFLNKISHGFSQGSSFIIYI